MAQINYATDNKKLYAVVEHFRPTSDSQFYNCHSRGNSLWRLP